MAAICQCDMCGKLDSTVKPDSELCDYCDTLVKKYALEANKLSWDKAKERFGRVVQAQVWVLGVMKDLLDKNTSEFEQYFGPVGLRILKEAAEELKDNQGEN